MRKDYSIIRDNLRVFWKNQVFVWQVPSRLHFLSFQVYALMLSINTVFLFLRWPVVVKGRWVDKNRWKSVLNRSWSFCYYRAPEDGFLPLTMRHYTQANDMIQNAAKATNGHFKCQHSKDLNTFLYQSKVYCFTKK